jgi:hypothetical protein
MGSQSTTGNGGQASGSGSLPFAVLMHSTHFIDCQMAPYKTDGHTPERKNRSL